MHREVYDAPRRDEACIPAQLQTVMTRLSRYPHHIGVVGADWCRADKPEKRSSTSFQMLTACYTSRWSIEQIDTGRRGSLSCYLGSKAPSDLHNWKRYGRPPSSIFFVPFLFPSLNHTTHAHDPAGLPSTAVDRTSNTWRNHLQAHLLLTNTREPRRR